MRWRGRNSRRGRNFLRRQPFRYGWLRGWRWRLRWLRQSWLRQLRSSRWHLSWRHRSTQARTGRHAFAAVHGKRSHFSINRFDALLQVVNARGQLWNLVHRSLHAQRPYECDDRDDRHRDQHKNNHYNQHGSHRVHDERVRENCGYYNTRSPDAQRGSSRVVLRLKLAPLSDWD